MSGHPEEMLDVVDEHNRVLRQAPRQEIHDHHLLHRAVHLIIRTDDNYFLLQRRSDTAPTFPGRWDSSAAGHVLAGASFGETVRKEAQEEIGYTIGDPAPVLLLEATPETDFEWVQFYAERVQERPHFHPDSDALNELRWWPENELTDAVAETPDHFTPVFATLFSLWKQTGYLVPEKQKGGWYDVALDTAHRLQVRRALLESAGLRARVEDDQHWLAPQGGRSLFGGRRDARQTTLCVPRESVPDAVALLYHSRPADDS